MNYKQLFTELKIPLKETSNNFVAIFTAIAGAFDSLRDFSIAMLESHFIQSKSSERLFAEERGIEKIKNESILSFQKRVLNAYSFLKNSPTRQGIESIIKSSTTKDFKIRELYREQFILGNLQEKLGENTQLQSSLASYYFVVGFTQALTVEEKNYVEEIIELYKPAHIGFHLNASISDDWILGKANEKLGKNTFI